MVTESTPEPDKFEDPLEDYDPKDYDDPLMQALAEEEIGTIRHEPFTAISPDMPVHEAVQKLVGLHIACLLVAEDDKLVGVFSDRDILLKVAFEYDQYKDRPVRDVMTKNPIFVYKTDSAAAALTVMALCGYRHVPVLDIDDKLVGIVSPQRVTEFLQQYFNQD